MKNIFYFMSFLFLTSFLILNINCSKDKNSNTTSTKSTINVTKPDKIDSPSNSGLLNPQTLDTKKVITVDTLNNSYFSLKGKKVTIFGYPQFFFDKGKIGKSVVLTAVAGDKRDLVECSMDKSYDEEISMKTAIVVTGEIKEHPKKPFSNNPRFNSIKLINCTLVSKGDFKDIANADYNNISSGTLKVDDFYKTYNAWIGKEISVIGSYWGTTTSILKTGNIVRVDLKSEIKDSKVKVGFQMKKAHNKIENRDGVIIKGKVEGEAFDNVHLIDCEFVNR